MTIQNGPKTWQRGYSLDFLKSLEARFSDYNAQLRSPFAAYKKNRIAEALARGELMAIFNRSKLRVLLAVPSHHPERDAVGLFSVTTSTRRGAITMYSDVVIGDRCPRDKIISNLVYEPGYRRAVCKYLAAIKESVWLFLLDEHTPHKVLAELLQKKFGYDRVGVKINTFGDIFGVYFKPAQGETRSHPTVSRFEALDVAQLRLPRNFAKNITATIERVRRTPLTFADHGSKYNKDHSWSGLALRGWLRDPTFIRNPESMSKPWQAEHSHITFRLQDTALATIFPEAMGIARQFAGQGKLYGIRLLRLAGGEGELQRHTDQGDAPGIADGKKMRIHVPIKTNSGVIFTVWGVDGKPRESHFPVGTAFYLDTRKPHTAVNLGSDERVHLVMDLEATDHLRSLLEV